MKRLPLLGPACALAVAVAGCSPLPPRLSPEDQQRVDAGWDRAFTPPDRLDRRTALDLLVGARLYDRGVDRLTARAEKRLANGTAVMEVQFDRAKPADDRFTLTVTDPAGKVVRTERYTRAEVDESLLALHGVEVTAEGAVGGGARVVVRQAEGDARRKRVEEFFPPTTD